MAQEDPFLPDGLRRRHLKKKKPRGESLRGIMARELYSDVNGLNEEEQFFVDCCKQTLVVALYGLRRIFTISMFIA